MSLTKCMSAVFNRHGVDTVDQEHLSELVREHLDIAGRNLEQAVTSSTGRKVLRAAVNQALADAKAERGTLLQALRDQHPDVFAQPKPAPAPAEAAAPAPSDAVEDTLREQITATGRYDDVTAAANAAIAAATYRVLGQRLGITPEEALRRFPLNVRGEAGLGALNQSSADGYFAPTAMESARELLTAWKSRETLVYMAPEDFLALAEGLDSPAPEKAGPIAARLDAGKPFESLPFLNFSHDDATGVATVTGHEGRHRAMALRERGVVRMPVLLRSTGGRTIRWGQQGNATAFDRVKTWPTELVGEDGRARRPFPVADPLARLEQGPKKRGPGSDIGHKREKGSGRYIGAPDWIGTSPQQLAVLRKKLRQLANEGERGRYWYEKSSRAILAMFNGDKIEAERFVGLIAIYSPNAQVPANTAMALNAYLQWKAGLPIKAGLGDGNRKAQALLDRNEWWDGIKTNSFYQNLMIEIDPTKLDPGVATMDMWMSLAADYGMKALDQGPKYRFLEREIQRLADELGWEAHQVQAAIWTGIKARIDPIRDQIKAAELASGIGEMYTDTDGKEKYRYKPTKAKEHFKLAHEMGMAREVPAATETDTAKTDYADVLQGLMVQMSWEATPSTSTGRSLPGIHKASLAEKIEYLAAVRAALTENGRDLVAELAGIPPGVTVQGMSAWEGAVGAGAQTFIPAPFEGAANRRHIKGVAADLLDLYANLLGYILEQDAVVYHAPIWTDSIKNRNGAELHTHRPLDATEMATLYNLLHNEFGTWGLAPGWRPDGVRILNFEDGLSNKDFQAGIARVVAQLPDTFGGGIPQSRFFRSDGNYISNNWRNSPNGEDYLGRINARRPDLPGRAAGLRARVAAVNGFFAERYGWDNPRRFTGGRLFQSDVRGGGDGRGVPAREVWRSVPRYAGGQAEGAISEAAIHFSGDEREELDSAFWGRGMKDAAAQRVKAGDDARLRQRIYFYLDNGSGVKPESGVGFNAHAVTLDNLYDAVADPLGLARGRSANEFESAILDAGFDGYVSQVGSGASARRAAVLLGERKVPVKAIGYAHEANQALAARRELAQGEEAPRGAYDIGTGTISLLANADRSTFVHELGHHHLEILTRLAAEPNANAGIKADVQALLDWFGVESIEAWQGMTLEAKRPYHEQFARGFEAYLAEGKAPTPQLEGIFARFKEWLLEVYQSLRDLDVELTPEVRAVFDRMLTEEKPAPQAAEAKQTDTAAFKKWFGDSKVVDENGEPLVVYHGSVERGLTTFDTTRTTQRGAGDEAGTFFTDDPGAATNYTRPPRGPDGRRLKTPPGSVTAAFLSLQNPLDITADIKRLRASGMAFGDAKRQALKKLDRAVHDGIVFRGDGANPGEYVAFRPEQIKSATGNRGTFSPESPNILEQRAPRRPADPVLAEALDLIGLGRPKTLAQRIKTYLSGGWGQIRADLAAASGHLKTGVFDKFNPIKQAELRLLGNLPAEQSSYVAARFSTGLSSLLRGVLMYGAPEWRGGIAQRVAGSKGLLDILSPVADDINDWLGWMVGMRAERLKGEGRENLLSDDHIAKLKALAGPAGSEKARRFQQVARDFAGFKRAVLDFAQTAGLIDATTRPAWDLADWIPFYRVMEDQGGGVRGPRNTQGLGWQSSGIRQLKGGESAMNDPLANILQNFAHLLDASMKNHAVRLAVQNFDGYGVFQELKVSERMGRALIPLSEVKRHLKEAGVDTRTLPQVALEGIAKMWSFQTPEGKDVIRVMMDGKARYFHVTDPEMLRALTAVDETAFGGIFKAFRFTKRLLTGAVTADPAFIARNFVRDMLHAWTINPDGMRIGIDSVRGLTKTLTETGGAIDMAFAGASFMGGYLNANDPTEVARSIRRALRDKGLSASAIDKHLATVIDTPVKLWEMYRRLGDSVENASREAAYEAALKAGKSKAQAAFEAKDLMDYSMRGQWAAIRALTDMLPFFNARLQGLYKLGRSGALPGPSIKAKVVAKGLTITLATLALMLANKDREEYDKLEDWDKDAYWHFWVDGEQFRLPKPFEIGLIYGTVPERLFRRFWTGQDDNEKFMRRMFAGMSDTLAFDPRPQLAKPIMEVISNKNAFTGRDIENISDEGVAPSARYNEGTSETARWLGENFSDATGVSPKQFEHLIRGYFGTIGSYVLGISDLVVRKATDMPTAPALRPDEIPVLSAFYRGSGPARSTRHTTEFYEMLREAEQTYRTVRRWREEGLVERAEQMATEKAGLLDARKTLTKASDRLSKIRKQLEQVARDPDMTAREKRIQMDELMAARNELVRETMQTVGGAR